MNIIKIIILFTLLKPSISLSQKKTDAYILPSELRELAIKASNSLKALQNRMWERYIVLILKKNLTLAEESELNAYKEIFHGTERTQPIFKGFQNVHM